jgi:hypothetical protein
VGSIPLKKIAKRTIFSNVASNLRFQMVATLNKLDRFVE